MATTSFSNGMRNNMVDLWSGQTIVAEAFVGTSAAGSVTLNMDLSATTGMAKLQTNAEITVTVNGIVDKVNIKVGSVIHLSFTGLTYNFEHGGKLIITDLDVSVT